MKLFLTTLAILSACFAPGIISAQKTVNSIAGVFADYVADLNKSEQTGKTDDQKKKLAYNPKMLNMFIANNISTYLSSSKDISLQKYYAILESGDGSLFVGYNFLFRKEKITRLKHIFNVGLKTDLEDNFSAILSDDKLNPELALNLKYTYIRPGKIKYGTDHSKMIDNYRANYLKRKYADDLAKYSAAEPAAVANRDENTELEAKLKYVTSLTATEKQELIDDQYVAEYEKIAADEEKFITDNKVFNSIVSSWITTEVYIPAGKREYKVSPSTAVFATTDEQFYNFSASISFTRMQKWSGRQTFYATASLGAFNTNNIIRKDLKAYKFETIVNQGGTNQTVGDSKDAYVGIFKKDFAQSLKGELVFFFLKDIAGISLSGEVITGDLRARNWKIAVPISLKDKDDKPSVNFELQYKEVFKTHLVGISVGFAFGKFFK